MPPLIFTIDLRPGVDDFSLNPCPWEAVPARLWEELAADIAGEHTLLPYPAEILAGRCEAGYAAAAMDGGQIVSYIALVPIVQRAPGAHAWTVLLEAGGASAEALPGSDVFEFTSAWTAPAWRRRHISLALRPLLIRQHLHNRALGLSGMVGLASPVLARLGWRITAWQALPFVSSLIAVSAADFPAQAAHGWRPPGNLARYQGAHILLDDPHHPWGQFCYCWVSDPAIAAGLEQELAALLHDDLPGWQAAVVAAFTRSGSFHRLAFL